MTPSQLSCETAVLIHIVAALYQTAQYSELRINAVPPAHSCTKMEQMWHKPRRMVSLRELSNNLMNEI